MFRQLSIKMYGTEDTLNRKVASERIQYRGFDTYVGLTIYLTYSIPNEKSSQVLIARKLR